MNTTKILSVEDPDAITLAKAIIQNGGLIAFPTDTVYGLAADPFNPVALQRIYQAKERPQEKALPVLIANLHQFKQFVPTLSDQVKHLAQTFWPGPLTLVMDKKPGLPSELSAYPTIGMRMPDLDFTLRLLCGTGPLATTSANISDESNTTTAEEVFSQLEHRVDLILDGGKTPGMTASTVLDTSKSDFRILRSGPISLEDIQAIFTSQDQ